MSKTDWTWFIHCLKYSFITLYRVSDLSVELPILKTAPQKSLYIVIQFWIQKWQKQYIWVIKRSTSNYHDIFLGKTAIFNEHFRGRIHANKHGVSGRTHKARLPISLTSSSTNLALFMQISWVLCQKNEGSVKTKQRPVKMGGRTTYRILSPKRTPFQIGTDWWSHLRKVPRRRWISHTHPVWLWGCSSCKISSPVPVLHGTKWLLWRPNIQSPTLHSRCGINKGLIKRGSTIDHWRSRCKGWILWPTVIFVHTYIHAEQLKQSITVPVYERGDKTGCSDNREISVINFIHNFFLISFSQG
jgi:hypothetical protein